MLVMKFKGAVLQNQETLAEIKNRIKEQNCCSIVVVSALKGVMPRLRQLYGLSLRRGAGFENEFNELKQVHEQLAYELLAGRKLEEFKWVKITENRKIERFVRYSASCRSIA